MRRTALARKSSSARGTSTRSRRPAAKRRRFAVCVQNKGYEASLERNKIYTVLPDVNGNCPAGMLPVYKFFDGRQDANQRHTIDLSVARAMANRAWIAQGFGPNHVAMCSGS